MTLIELAHGAGGRVMQKLLEEVIIPSFSKRRIGDIGLDEMDDGASLNIGSTSLIICADAHTVQPLFFPGGNIGTLTACGTINDIAVMGAKPIAMTNTIVVEEGFEIETLREILLALDLVIDPLGVAMIAGDTKVMPKGTVDQLIMSTTGIGEVYLDRPVADTGAQEGDMIIVTGPIGDHGATLLAHRDGLDFDVDLISDVAPLWNPIRDCLDICRINAMKDPTRGGASVALNEIALKSRVEIEVQESLLPVRSSVQSLCEILGLNPLNLSCEGIVVMAVSPLHVDAVLEALKKHQSTKDARVVGQVGQGPSRVVMNTEIGGRKIIQVPHGEPIPRVC